MLDLNFVRDHLPQVEEKLRQRGTNAAEVLKDFAAIDAERRQAITASETLQAQRNRASEEIAKLKKNGQDASAQINETKQLREQIQESEKKAAQQEARLREILTAIPNLPHDSVPIGKSAEDNVEARRWGSPPKFNFKPKPHWELGEELGILDLERAAKISGARFAVSREREAITILSHLKGCPFARSSQSERALCAISTRIRIYFDSF